MITQAAHRNYQLLIDPSLEAGVLMKSLTGSNFMRDMVSYFTTKVQDFKAMKIATQAASINTQTKYLRTAFLDMDNVMLAVPQGMNVSYMEYITGLNFIKDQLDLAMKSVISANDALDLILSRPGAEESGSPVLSYEPKTIDDLMAVCKEQLTVITGSRNDQAKMAYTDAVNSHAEWRNVVTGLEVLRSRSQDMKVIVHSMDRMDETAKNLVALLADASKVSKIRGQEISKAMYSVASVYEMYAQYYSMVTQLDVCVKANIAQINT